MAALRLLTRTSRPLAASLTHAARAAHTLPELPYAYDALEPIISKEIMETHHSKHHQAYVNGLNAGLESLAKAEEANDVSSIIALKKNINFNGGGHINHSIFWTNLAPSSEGGGVVPSSGAFIDAVNSQFGSIEVLKEHMNAAGAGVQGSGWVWLGYNKGSKQLEIATTANQDPLQATLGYVPLLGIDVWEHAYYLQYKNVRPEYLKSIWSVVNFENVAQRYDEASN
eukprot:m.332580 g.332580  ORF g.332580 m.332580 type:complete len:227 (+) comp16962_c0_seq1:32-712(+)